MDLQTYKKERGTLKDAEGLTILNGEIGYRVLWVQSIMPVLFTVDGQWKVICTQQTRQRKIAGCRRIGAKQRVNQKGQQGINLVCAP